MTLIDTADAYHLNADEVGHNETLIARAVASYGGDTSDVLIATKGGHLRPGDGSWTIDGRPEYLKAACDASLKRLGVDAIGLYQHHRPDPTVPYADSIGADPRPARRREDPPRRHLQRRTRTRSGRRRRSSAGGWPRCRTSSRPRSVAPSRNSRCAPNSAWRSCPTRRWAASRRAGDLGGRFAEFARVADAHGVSPQRVCLAWLLAKGPTVVPIPGASRPETIRDSAAAADLTLTDEEVARLDAAPR